MQISQIWRKLTGGDFDWRMKFGHSTEATNAATCQEGPEGVAVGS